MISALLRAATTPALARRTRRAVTHASTMHNPSSTAIKKTILNARSPVSPLWKLRNRVVSASVNQTAKTMAPPVNNAVAGRTRPVSAGRAPLRCCFRPRLTHPQCPLQSSCAHHRHRRDAQRSGMLDQANDVRIDGGRQHAGVVLDRGRPRRRPGRSGTSRSADHAAAPVQPLLMERALTDCSGTSLAKIPRPLPIDVEIWVYANEGWNEKDLRA